MMDPAGSQPTLGDLKPSAFPQQHVRNWDPDVLELHLHVAVRRVVIAEYR